MVATRVDGALVCLCGRRGIEYQQLLKGLVLIVNYAINNPGRPIVSSNNHPTERISQFVDYYLKPLVCTVPSYVKDTTDFLKVPMK